MSKIWLCGISNFREWSNLKELFDKTKDYVDGFVWTIDHRPELLDIYDLVIYRQFQEWLEANKKDGKIIYYPYNRQHDFLANCYLFDGIIKNEDYCLIFDSKELPTDFFIENIKLIIENLEAQNSGALYCSGRPYAFKYYDHQFFSHNPHWTLNGVVGNINVIPENEKDSYIINKRKLSPEMHYSIHNTKYYYEFGRSNQMELTYGKFGRDIVNKHELLRFQFRDYCRKELKLEFTLDSLEEYFKIGKYTDSFIDNVQREFCLSEFFQIKSLQQNFMGNRPEVANGMHPRFQWSFKNYLKTGCGWSDKDYQGRILVYNKEFNIHD